MRTNPLFFVLIVWLPSTSCRTANQPSKMDSGELASVDVAAASSKSVPLPEGMSTEWWNTVQTRIRSSSRAIRPSEVGFEASLSSIGKTARFDSEGVLLVDHEGAPVLAIRTVAFGRGDDLDALPDAEPRLGACSDSVDVLGECLARLEIARSGLIETWSTHEQGLEQGWTLETRPSGQGTLNFHVAIGEALSLDTGGDAESMALIDASGGKWTVGEVRAWDVRGQELLAWLETDGMDLGVRVDDEGAVYPVTVDPIYATAAWTVVGADGHDAFGHSLSDAGDVNGDGYEDVIVGTYDTESGAAFVFHGSAAGLTTTASASLDALAEEDGFGFSVSGAGDVNGDGYDDVIVGAWAASRAYLYQGSAAGISTTPSNTLSSGTGGSRFGVAVSGGGDLNADGYDDIIVGQDTSYGVVHIFHGSSTGLSTSASRTLSGSSSTGGDFGSSLAGVGDVNGDGYDDILVGAPNYSGYTGRAYVYHGSGTGIGSSPASTITGTSSSQMLGFWVSGAGDVDGDGYSDIIVGAPMYSSYTGRAYVYRGSSAGVSTTAATTLSGTSSGDYFGLRVSGSFDANNDGYSEVVVGSYVGDDSNVAYVYPGSAAGTVTSSPTTLDLGYYTEFDPVSVAGVRDVNGDGYDEVLVGGAGYLVFGAAYLYEGGPSGASTVVSTTLYGIDDDTLGRSVSDAGDVNGDGYSDVIVGASGFRGYTGYALLFLGSALGLPASADTFLFNEDASSFGYSVDSAGDINGDGYDDLIVGAPDSDDGAGWAFLYNGSPTGVSTVASTLLTGTSSSERFGHAVSGAGDVNHDGYDDVVIGADTYGSLGRVYVFHGSSSGPPPTAARVLTGSAGKYIGFSVDDAGDVNGDGFADIIVGSLGTAYIFHGSSSGMSSTAGRTLTLTSTDEYFGRSVGGAGDVNGDGYGDVIIGSYRYSSSAGRVFLYLGSPSGIEASPAWEETGPTSSCFGWSVSGAGDIDSDGYDDVIIGAYYYGSGLGLAEVCYGSTSGLSSSSCTSLTGDVSGSYLGVSVSKAGDVNGDGFNDVIVGACGWSGGGRASLFYGYNIDTDADGYPDSADCEPENPDVHPSAIELCNGLDDDCDGSVDEEASGTTPFYRDSDRDGYGDAASSVRSCAVPTGYVSDYTDCDDTRATVFPAAPESCNGIDDDCDGSFDESGAFGESTWYLDADGDAYGSSSTTTLGCTAPTGYVATLTDCDDTQATVHPGAAESCDGIDNNCDGSADDVSTWYLDHDGDTYGTSSTMVRSCAMPMGYTATSTDCDDTRAAVHPGATEACNDFDDDCDGFIDEGAPADASTWYFDMDHDGYGNPLSSVVSCSAPTDGVTDHTDCDDTHPDVHPSATELCNGIDDDCDSTVDESDASDAATWYRDADSDGYGSATVTLRACACPTGYIADPSDCDDTTRTVSPAAIETCNRVDDDCDGTIDEPDASDSPTWYPDADEDGYAAESGAITSCTAPAGFLPSGGPWDCDDANGAVHPEAKELPADGVDEDCDGYEICYVDSDLDGHGTAATTPSGTLDCAGKGAARTSDDCDDTRADVHPGATETAANATDENCDGWESCYIDADKDGFGSSEMTSAELSCSDAGLSTNADDCSDTSAAVHPGAKEIIGDGIDEDCDGGEICHGDADGDGYGSTNTVSSANLNCFDSGEALTSVDCDDEAASTYPGASETCNGQDDDCDGTIDEGGVCEGADTGLEGGKTGCGCTTADTGQWSLWSLVLALTLAVGRRERNRVGDGSVMKLKKYLVKERRPTQ